MISIAICNTYPYHFKKYFGLCQFDFIKQITGDEVASTVGRIKRKMCS
jgi:hypothetical protein